MKFNILFIIAPVLLALNVTTLSAKETKPPLKTSPSVAVQPAPLITSSAENEKLVKSILESMYKGELPMISPSFSGNFIDHDANRDSSFGIENMISFSNNIRIAIPDVKLEIQSIRSFENKDLVFSKIVGSYAGPFRGFPPSGRTISLYSADLFVIDNRLVSARWNVCDLSPLCSMPDPVYGASPTSNYLVPSVNTSITNEKDSIRSPASSQSSVGKKKSTKSKDSKGK